MTSSTPRRHRRLALMAAGMAAAMVLLPGAASAQVVHTAQQFADAPADPGVPGVPGDPNAPQAPVAPAAPTDPAKAVTDLVGGLKPDQGPPSLTGDRDRGGVEHRDDSPDSDHLEDPRPPDHASGTVADIDVLKSHILDITKYDASIEDNGKAHADAEVLSLGGDGILGTSSSSSSGDKDKKDDHGVSLLNLCDATGGGLCLSLLYADTVATEDRDSSLAAARGGVLALCLGGKEKDAITSYDCDGLGLGLAEGRGFAERDKKHGHTRAESANELLNLCLGKREKLTEPCEGIGVQAVHADSASKSDKPDTERGSYLLGIDLNGSSTYLLDQPLALGLIDGCGDSAVLCLLLNQGKSVIFKNPKGAGSVQEMLRLDVLNRTLLVVLGQAETLAHETEGHDHGKDHGGPPECDDRIDNDDDGDTDSKDKDCDSPQDDSEDGNGDHGDKGGAGGSDELADTGADVASLLAGGFLLTGLGALTVAATRRRVGKHSV